jgi:hypothetical protein
LKKFKNSILPETIYGASSLGYQNDFGHSKLTWGAKNILGALAHTMCMIHVVRSKLTLVALKNQLGVLKIK